MQCWCVRDGTRTAGSCTAAHLTVVDVKALLAVLSAQMLLLLFFLFSFFLHDLVFVKPSNRFPVLVVMSERSWPPVTIFLPLWLNMEQQAHADKDIARDQLHRCRLRLVLNSFVGRRPSPAETYLCCRSTWAIALALVSNWTHPLMSQDIWSLAWNET